MPSFYTADQLRALKFATKFELLAIQTDCSNQTAAAAHYSARAAAYRAAALKDYTPQDYREWTEHLVATAQSEPDGI